LTYLDRLQDEIAESRPVAMVKLLSVPDQGNYELGQTILVSASGILYPQTSDLQPLVKAAQEMLAQGRSGATKVAMPDCSVRVYVESHLPQQVLVVIGAGHVGQMVARAGDMAGFPLIVLDDRSEYAHPNLFPLGARVICGDFEDELAALELGVHHHVILVTRGHQQDSRCLRLLVNAPVPYLGMIGSRTRVKTIFEILIAQGVKRTDLERVRAPVGLDLGGRTPGEIAISVVAEVIATRHGGTGLPMKLRR